MLVFSYASDQGVSRLIVGNKTDLASARAVDYATAKVAAKFFHRLLIETKKFKNRLFRPWLTS